MEEQKLTSLEKMTADGFKQHPQQAIDAINEYLENIPQNKAAIIKNKFNTQPQYLESFKVAITQTSLIVFIAALKVTQVHTTVDFERFVREFLLFARQDDKDIFEMREFYLKNLDAKEMKIAELAMIEDGEHDLEESKTEDNETENDNEEENEEKDTPQEINYNTLISNLLTQYTERNIHLV